VSRRTAPPSGTPKPPGPAVYRRTEESEAFHLTRRRDTMTELPQPAPGALRLGLDQLGRTKLAFAGAVAIACLALVAVFADLLASDLPIACHVKERTFILPNITRPPALAAYDCERVEDELGVDDWAIFPLVRYGPTQTSARGHIEALRPPHLFGHHPLGTDDRGRDVFARLVHGARTSLTVGLIAVLAFVGIGAVLGAIAGFFGGAMDSIVSRLVETLTAFPTLVLVLVVQAVLPQPTMATMLLAIGLTRWTEVARLVRAEVLFVSSQDYVMAARALGAPPWRVLRKHVVPNALAPILVAATFGIASVVLIEASLTFLRVGLPPPAPSWGETLSEARDHATAWWLLVLPGLAVFGTVISLNLVGEALRDALDPRLRHAAERTVPTSRAALTVVPPPTSAAIDQTPGV
jgi:peptide/nickel transport system permease protein